MNEDAIALLAEKLMTLLHIKHNLRLAFAEAQIFIYCISLHNFLKNL